MLKHTPLATLIAASTLVLLPAIPGMNDAHAQITMNLASAGPGGGVSAIVESYSHSITIPQDAVSARARGRRIHKPFTVRKRLDAATPLLYRALSNSETIPTVTIRIPTTRITRGPTLDITLTDARIMSINSASTAGELAMEEISFNYAKIKWSWSDGGISHEDTWGNN